MQSIDERRCLGGAGQTLTAGGAAQDPGIDQRSEHRDPKGLPICRMELCVTSISGAGATPRFRGIRGMRKTPVGQPTVGTTPLTSEPSPNTVTPIMNIPFRPWRSLSTPPAISRLASTIA